MKSQTTVFPRDNDTRYTDNLVITTPFSATRPTWLTRMALHITTTRCSDMTLPDQARRCNEGGLYLLRPINASLAITYLPDVLTNKTHDVSNTE
jgi:hypothetical protein